MALFNNLPFGIELIPNKKEEWKKQLKKIRKEKKQKNLNKDHLDIPEFVNSFYLNQRLR